VPDSDRGCQAIALTLIRVLKNPASVIVSDEPISRFRGSSTTPAALIMAVGSRRIAHLPRLITEIRSAGVGKLCRSLPVSVVSGQLVRGRKRDGDVVCMWSAGRPPDPVDNENRL